MTKSKYWKITKKDLQTFYRHHVQNQNDWYNNQFHLSGYSGLINDPNGLVFYKNKYYIFMQNCPFSIHHHNKSWILYTTIDFINYEYYGIVLTPSNKYDTHGVYSGSCIVLENKLEFYYTGNIKFSKTKRTSYTLKANIDFANKTTHKTMLFQTDHSKYTGHFRDPFLIKKNKNLFMLNGAQNLKKEGVLSIYKLESNNWLWQNDLFLPQINKRKHYMVECPNYFKINNKEFLLYSLEQYGSLKSGSHFVWIQEVKTNNSFNIKFLNQAQKMDLGFDFYAPQIFSNTLDRSIILGWLGNSKSNPIPNKKIYGINQLTIPRQIFLRNNKIYQTPIVEINKLRLYKIQKNNDKYIYENGLVEIMLDNIANNDFFVEIESLTKCIKITKEGTNFIIDRSNTDYQDEKNLPSKLKFDNLIINKLRVLIDRSCLEIFINDGESVISARFFVKNHHIIKTNWNNTIIFQLKGFSYKWNNQIFVQNDRV